MGRGKWEQLPNHDETHISRQNVSSFKPKNRPKLRGVLSEIYRAIERSGGALTIAQIAKQLGRSNNTWLRRRALELCERGYLCCYYSAYRASGPVRYRYTFSIAQ
jgi:hypothetical protein